MVNTSLAAKPAQFAAPYTKEIKELLQWPVMAKLTVTLVPEIAQPTAEPAPAQMPIAMKR